MKGLHNIYKSLLSDSELDYREVFPAFFEQDKKTKVLFVCPRMDAFGLRNMFVPALGLSNTPKMASCIFMAQKSNNEHLTELRQDIDLPSEIVQQADVIIFPFCDVRLRPIYALIRELKPTIRIAFIVDFPIEQLKDYHFSKKTYNKVKENIYENIYFADKVFIPCESYNEEIRKMVDGKFEISKPLLTEVYNTKISPIVVESIDFQKMPELFNPPPPYRVGFYSQHAGVGRNEKEIELIKFCQENEEKFEYVIYGANPFGNRKDKKIEESNGLEVYEDNSLAKLSKKFNGNFKPIRRVQTNDYIYHFKNIYKLGLSIAVVMPKRDDFFNLSPFPFIIEELALMQIPVITDIPLNKIQKEGVFFVSNINEAKEILRSLTPEMIADKGQRAQEVFGGSILTEQEHWVALEQAILSDSIYSF